jgi:hypothetical protein
MRPTDRVLAVIKMGIMNATEQRHTHTQTQGNVLSLFSLEIFRTHVILQGTRRKQKT